MNSHLKKYSHLFNQEGTDREKRYLPALHPESVAIDDRKLKDLLVHLQRFSKHILFIDGDKPAGKDGRPGGQMSWNDILKKDIALLAAHIASFPLPEIAGEYDLLQELFDRERTVANFIRLLEPVYSGFRKVDEWYCAAVEEGSETKLKKDLEIYIQSYLSRKLTDLRQIDLHVRSLAGGSGAGIHFRAFRNTGNVWGDGHAEDHAYGGSVFIGKDEQEKLLNGSYRLKEIFDTAYHVMGEVVNYCTAYLQESLPEKKDRQPHIALLLAFLKLYGYAQEEINKIPEKYLDYYYGQVLGIGRRSAQPDSVYVNFEPAKGFDPYELKKGTPLSAGKDKLNKELIYVTDKDIVVNKSAVAAIRNIYIDKDGHNQVLQYYANSSDDPAGEGILGSLFGGKAGDTGVRIGFALASAQFNLTKGERNVVLRFELENDILTEQFDTDILELLLTGEKGWLSSEQGGDGVLIHSFGKTDDRVLELNFTVAIGQPSAIVAFSPKIHQGNFVTGLPVLQCLLKYPSRSPEPDAADPGGEGDAASPRERDAASRNAYQNKIIQLNNLQKIRPVNTVITVQVGQLDTPVSFDGVRELQLQNHEAILDPKKPFFPFTSMPKAGSSFYIGGQDLYCKPLQRLTLNMEWMLPDHFQSYYDKYLPPYDSNKFTASLSILKKKKWRKIRDVSIIDTDSSNPKWRSIKIDLNEINSDAEIPQDEGTVARFDTSKPDGMLKLKLNYPDFGHSIYAQLITSSVMEKASAKHANPDFYKIVKKQLHDSLISIKLPPNAEKRDGHFKTVIYKIAEDPDRTDEEVRAMMIKGLSGIIRDLNNDYTLNTPGRAVKEEPGVDVHSIIVNDDSLIERFMRLIRGIKPTTHYERDREGVGEVADEINKKFEPVANFILPSERELVGIIINVTNSAIDQTVVKVVDEIIAIRKTGMTETAVGAIFKTAFDESNKVINDMIAMKIATVLLANEVPPPPYTPQINMISVSYLSSRSCSGSNDQFFRVGPFGVAEIGEGEAFFDEASLKKPAGLLFIGVRDILPGQGLSLLLNLVDGVSMAGKTPPGISWQYLAGNKWKRLPDDCLVSDGTYGLQATGILQFSMPQSADTKGTLFDIPGLQWLCASVARDAGDFPSLAGIFTNAVRATFSDQKNDPMHGALPLPAGKITRLADKVTAIKKVSQPLASFHGKVGERRQEYYTRVSERLRHKSRAVNNWDYERLVLENFPGVFKVKCLNNYRDGRFARGHVTVLPICDMRNKEDTGVDILAPHAGYIVLKEIELLLNACSSPFVKVHAINPLLSRVFIQCRVKFNSGVDKGYALQKLNMELIRLLTPWAGGDKEQPSFSAKIYAFNIISFIDKRDYVDYVDDLAMRQYVEEANGERVYCMSPAGETSLVETQFIAGHALLVSAPAHAIQWIE